MEKKKHFIRNIYALFFNIFVLMNSFLIFLDNNIDKVGVDKLYLRIGLIATLWLLCISISIIYFVKKLWQEEHKGITILMIVLCVLLTTIRISDFGNCLADVKSGAISVTTNQYPVVWDKIFLSDSGDEYAYVSDDIAETLNDNKVLTITTNFDIEREKYVEVVYYPHTHILISVEIVQ